MHKGDRRFEEKGYRGGGGFPFSFPPPYQTCSFILPYCEQLAILKTYLPFLHLSCPDLPCQTGPLIFASPGIFSTSHEKREKKKKKKSTQSPFFAPQTWNGMNPVI